MPPILPGFNSGVQRILLLFFTARKRNELNALATINNCVTLLCSFAIYKRNSECVSLLLLLLLENVQSTFFSYLELAFSQFYHCCEIVFAFGRGFGNKKIWNHRMDQVWNFRCGDTSWWIVKQFKTYFIFHEYYPLNASAKRFEELLKKRESRCLLYL